MRIIVDRTKCSSIGLCEATAADIFRIDLSGALEVPSEEIPEERRAELDLACEYCPTQALRIQD